MNNSKIVGCDIGGSHISSALVDVTKGEVIINSLSRKVIDSHLNSEVIIDDWCGCIKETLEKDGGDCGDIMIGIAMPGPFDYEAGICLIKNQDKYEDLYNKNIKELIAKNLSISKKNIGIMNDASCFLQGEMLAGVGKKNNSGVGLTLGTGLGSAIYQNGNVTDGELWNTPFRNKIAEDYLSTRWFVQQYLDETGIEIQNVENLAKRAGNGDKKAMSIFEMFGENLAEFISLNLAKYNAELLILGGNISKAHEFFLSNVLEHLKIQSVNMEIKIANLGEMSAIHGSAGIFRL